MSEDKKMAAWEQGIMDEIAAMGFEKFTRERQSWRILTDSVEEGREVWDIAAPELTRQEAINRQIKLGETPKDAAEIVDFHRGMLGGWGKIDEVQVIEVR